MRNKQIALIAAASMIAHSSRLTDGVVLEIKAEKPMKHDDYFEMDFGNRAERRGYGSSKKRMKGLRP